ncbi:dockerin type I domain-containing protein [Faecalibacillus faecis]|uniref:dockerin type I domain-containing protein n=1 Tax=Faecalibacillus faecis TaxID=1982628 RepID=UPI003867AAE6
MRKIALCLFSIALMSSLFINVKAENVSKSDNDVTEDFFVNLDEEGNPIVVDIEDTFNKKEYNKSLQESEEPTVQNESTEDTNTEALLNSKKTIHSNQLMKTTTAQNNHIVRFKTVAEIGGTLTYTETDTGRQGYISTNSSNDAAFISKNSDGTITCKLSGVEMKVPESSVKSIVSYSERNVSYYYASEGKFIHKYSYISGSSVSMASCRVGFQPSYIKSNTVYYSYDGHYFYTSFANMISDYKNKVHNQAVNNNDPYYSYYQYLSLRSKTTMTASNLNNRTKSYSSSKYATSKMYEQGQTFINNQNTYGINAALMFGVAYNESAAGTSSIAQNKNNIFGLNAVDSSPGQSANYFASVNQCIQEFAYNWMSQGYLSGNDSRYRGPHLGDKHSGINVKYASDAYWGEKAAAQSYYMADNLKSDYQHYTIAISSSTELSLYKEANTNNRLYTSGVSGTGTKGYLYDYPVLILEKGNDWSKVQSDMPLIDSRTSRNIKGLYDFNRDYVYAQTKYLNNRTSSVTTPTETPVTYLPGDVNGDGKVNSLDYIKVKNHIMGTSPLTGDDLKRADVNNDGKVSSLDYIKIKNHIMGTSKLF